MVNLAHKTEINRLRDFGTLTRDICVVTICCLVNVLFKDEIFAKVNTSHYLNAHSTSIFIYTVFFTTQSCLTWLH